MTCMLRVSSNDVFEADYVGGRRADYVGGREPGYVGGR